MTATAGPERPSWGAAKPVSEEGLSKILASFDGSAEKLTVAQDTPVLRVVSGKLQDLARFLRDDPDLQFGQLVLVTGVHWPGRESDFEVIYQLRSLARGLELELKVLLKGPDPEVPTLCGVWPGADWLERETYDLVGIRFAGHPDLRRILMAEGTLGHPLRKDHPRRAPKFSMRRSEHEGTPDLLEKSPG